MPVSDANRVVITILDKDYPIACPPEERDALVRAAQELNNRMRTIRNTGSIIGLERIAVMAALNLCHELHQLKNGSLDNSSEDITRIIDKIDASLD